MSERIEKITDQLVKGNTVVLTTYAGRINFTPATYKKCQNQGLEMFRESGGHLEYRSGKKWLRLINGSYKATVISPE